MGGVGSFQFGGSNQTQMALLLQQQRSDQRRAQTIMSRIGHVPQGGPTNTHGDVHRAVNLGGAKTFVEGAPGNLNTLAPGGPEWVEGLGVDLNGDGRFEQGTDGHLVLDLDGNGVYDRKDIKDTLRMLEMFSGAGEESGINGSQDDPFNGFGAFNQGDQAETLLLEARGKQADLNRDGVLSSWELTRMGGRVVVADGYSNGEASSLKTHALPGAYTPNYQPQPQYYPQAAVLGGQPPYGQMSSGPPAYFMQVLHSFMSMFARPY